MNKATTTSKNELIINGFTPSESVILNRELFCPAKATGGFTGIAKIFRQGFDADTEAIIFSYIITAILANVKAGLIALEIEADKTTGVNKVFCIPTNNEIQWPDYTLESRIVPDEKISVTNVVNNWIIEECEDPTQRALELSHIMLVIRGFVTMSYNKRDTREYAPKDPEIKQYSIDSAKSALDRLLNFKGNEADVYQTMVNDIILAIKNLTHIKESQNEFFKSPDPWDAETPGDKEKYQVTNTSFSKRNMIVITITSLIIAVSIFLVFKYSTAQDWYHAWYFTGGAATGLIIILVYTLGRLFTTYFDAPLVKAEIGDNSVSLSAPVKKKPLQLAVNVVLAFPFICFSVIIIEIMIVNKPILGLGIILLIFFGIMRVIQKKIAKSISNIVAAEPQESSLSTQDAFLAKTGHENFSSIQNPQFVSVKTKVISLDSLPAISEESKGRIEETAKRFPAVKRIFINNLFILCIGAVVLQALFYLYKQNSKPDFDNSSLIVEIVLLGFTIAFQKIKGLNLKSLFFKAIDIDLKFDDDEIGSIRPSRLSLIGVFWMLVTIINLNWYAKERGLPAILFCILAIALIIFYIFQIQTQRRLLEKKIPYHLPLNLLALRVFGSKHLSNFLEIISGWKVVGTINRLDGFDTVGEKASDFFNYIRGRVKDSIIENDEELKTGLKRFSSSPDKQLAFPANSMQCTNATWKTAIQHLIENADVIVLDLSNLSEKNQGVAYELGKLFNEVPLRKILLLIDYSTDRKVLQKILDQSWGAMSVSSPNHSDENAEIKLFDSGGLKTREPEESLYAWKKRVDKRIEGSTLVALLLDMANHERQEVMPDKKKDASFIHWTGWGFSEGGQKAWNITWALILSIILCLVIS